MGKLQAGYSFGHYGGSNIGNMAPPKGYNLKQCSLCGDKAIYYAGRYAFCFEHKGEAILATQRRLKTYPSFIMQTMRDPNEPYEMDEVEG